MLTTLCVSAFFSVFVRCVLVVGQVNDQLLIICETRISREVFRRF